MAEQSTSHEGFPQRTSPHPLLTSLERLVGTWKISGPGLDGRVTYSWLDGGFFLIQHVDLHQDGQKTYGIEIIGYDEKRERLTSHYFGGNSGEVLEYEYAVDEKTLTIWFGSEGSPAFYKGEWSNSGNTNKGAWQWPGGGYESTMIRELIS